MLANVMLAAATALVAGFRNPPMSARPQAWWHWMNGNVSRAGITADLEAVKTMGLGGLTLFDAGCGVPAGPLKFASDEWYATVKHATDEARRLGLEILTPTCSGWSSSGGPWIPKSMSMKVLEHTEVRVSGPGPVTVKLPSLPDPHGYSADIAAFAVPVPAVERETMEKAGVRVSAPDEFTRVLSFPQPYAAAGVAYRLEHPWAWEIDGEVTLEASDDGVNFKWLRTADANVARRADSDRSLRYEPLPPGTVARHYRIRFNFTTTAADPNDRRAIKAIKLAELRLTKAVAIANLADKSLRKRAPVTRAPAAPASAVVAKDAVRDVSDCLAADGTFKWEVPAGEWRIIRLGYAINGKKNHPASDCGEGPEVDKLSSAAVEYHFDHYAAKMPGIAGFIVDSYEIGCQNWTPDFEREFQRRRGYAMRPYMPVLAGVVIGSVDESERFLYDFRRTVADLFAENYGGALAKRCHQRGQTLSLEPYGNCPCDDLEYGEYADIPMGEFWSRINRGERVTEVGNAKLPSYFAHVWGRRYVGAEAFTASECKWRTTPYALKAQGDRAFASGVNRLIFHTSTHQPWVKPNRMPGTTLGPYGLYLNRANTWWRQARAWMDYLARCQWLLQEGTSAADILFWHGEEAPSREGHLVKYPADFGDVPVPAGYDRDVCSTKALMKLQVRDGRIIAPSGASYALLVLQQVDEMSPEALAAVDRIVSAGGRVAAPQRPRRMPGLRDYPHGDERIQAASAAVWAKGVITGAAREGIAAIGLEPDFRCLRAPEGLEGETAWIRRVYPGGMTAYFVAVPNAKAGTCVVSFRVDGMEPELWDAETSETGLAPAAWRRVDGRTEVTLDLPPSGSAFVVFRKPTAAGGSAPYAPVEPKTLAELTGPWTLTFPIDWYTDGSATKTLELPQLVDWTQLADNDCRYFSGTATYTAEFVVSAAVARAAATAAQGARFYLDLGEVKNFAEVEVNGRALPTLWKPPYRVDITDDLRRAAKGEAVAAQSPRLQLVIKVTNLWPNRMIGDDVRCAPDCEWTQSVDCGLKRIPDFVIRGLPSPTGRKTFATWRYWTKDDALLSSGLLGPVRLLQAGGDLRNPRQDETRRLP